MSLIILKKVQIRQYKDSIACRLESAQCKRGGIQNEGTETTELLSQCAITLVRCVAIKIAVWVALKDLCTFSTDSSSQLDVFGHDGDPLCVNCAEIGVFEETNEVCFRSFLEGSDGCALET